MFPAPRPRPSLARVDKRHHVTRSSRTLTAATEKNQPTLLPFDALGGSCHRCSSCVTRNAMTGQQAWAWHRRSCSIQSAFPNWRQRRLCDRCTCTAEPMRPRACCRCAFSHSFFAMLICRKAAGVLGLGFGKPAFYFNPMETGEKHGAAVGRVGTLRMTDKRAAPVNLSCRGREQERVFGDTRLQRVCGVVGQPMRCGCGTARNQMDGNVHVQSYVCVSSALVVCDCGTACINHRRRHSASVQPRRPRVRLATRTCIDHRFVSSSSSSLCQDSDRLCSCREPSYRLSDPSPLSLQAR